MTQNTETPTPRTDALIASLPAMNDDCRAYLAMFDYARTLERELAEERGYRVAYEQQAARLRAALEDALCYCPKDVRGQIIRAYNVPALAGGDSDEPEGYKPESAALYDGSPDSGSIVSGARKLGGGAT